MSQAAAGETNQSPPKANPAANVRRNRRLRMWRRWTVAKIRRGSPEPGSSCGRERSKRSILSISLFFDLPAQNLFGPAQVSPDGVQRQPQCFGNVLIAHLALIP